jgi:hypothetical protein
LGIRKQETRSRSLKGREKLEVKSEAGRKAGSGKVRSGKVRSNK